MWSWPGVQTPGASSILCHQNVGDWARNWRASSGVGMVYQRSWHRKSMRISGCRASQLCCARYCVRAAWLRALMMLIVRASRVGAS